MESKRCPECGNICGPDDSFCPKCGREFKGKVVAPASLPGMQAPVEVPEDRTPEQLVDDGFGLMAEDHYTDACEYWTKAVKDGYVPDDDTYARMLRETGECMLRISNTANVTIRKGAADLSMVLDDRDFSTDLLNEYASRVKDCSGQVMLVNLSTNYVILMIECFSVYTDLRDLQQLCLNAQLFLKSVLEREEELKDDGSLDPPKARKYIDTNIGLVNSLEAQITSAINRTSIEDLDRLSDYWSDQNELPYTANLLMALQFSIQLRVTGKFSSKMFMKTRDGEVLRFLAAYVSGLKH